MEKSSPRKFPVVVLESPNRVAAELDLDPGTVRQYAQRFDLPGIFQIGTKGRVAFAPEFKAALRKKLG